MVVSDRRAIDAATRLITTTGKDRDGYEAAAEAHVQNNGEESEEGDTT